MINDARQLPRMREQLVRDSLQIAQIAEMGLPAHVEILASRDSRGVVMSVEQLVHPARQLLARPRKGAIGRRG